MIMIVVITILTLINNVVSAENISISAEAATLIDYDTGEVLYEKNSHVKLYPASTTKMLTAILAVENSELSETVTVNQDVINLTYGSHIALEPGETLTMEQMLHALLIPSANDAALAIAIHVGGSVENFTRMMNAKAIEIGAVDSNFINPNGLHDDRHVSSAHDLALIGRYAMNNETIRNIVNKVTYEIPPTNKKSEPRHLKVTNKLLFSNETIDVNGKNVPIRLDYASGVKTGYTSDASNCLVSYAEKDGQRLISVILKAGSNNEVYRNTHILFDYGFNSFKSEVLRHENEFIINAPVVDGVSPVISGVMDRDISFMVPNGEGSDIEEKVTLIDNLVAPISKGQILGQVEFIKEGNIIAGGNILATDVVQVDPMTTKTMKILKNWYWYVFGILFLIRLYNMQRRKAIRRRRRRNARRR